MWQVNIGQGSIHLQKHIVQIVTINHQNETLICKWRKGNLSKNDSVNIMNVKGNTFYASIISHAQFEAIRTERKDCISKQEAISSSYKNFDKLRRLFGMSS